MGSTHDSMVTAAVERAAEAVVAVGSGRSAGSGAVIDAGLVLTNAHNAPDREVGVRFSDGRAATAVRAGADVEGDLAVLRVDTAAAPLRWAGDADGATPAIGERVVGLANPLGRGLHASPGVVAAVDQVFRGPAGRAVRGALVHTAPLPRGASGGPLLDADGALLALNTHRLGDGLYLARPVTPQLRVEVDALARGEHPDRPRLGVAVAPPPVAHRLRTAVGLPARDGLLVRHVEPDSPADEAGLTSGDLLVELDGAALTDVDALAEAVAAHDPAAPLHFRAVRGAEERAVQVRLAPVEAEEDGA